MKNTSAYCSAVLVALALISTPAFSQGGKKAAKPAAAPEAAAPVPAPAGPVAQPGAPKDDKVDISDLENKYWAPKDTDFSVVQNRTYSKVGRFMLSPGIGTLINDPYSTGAVVGLTGNYFWSERMGVQATYFQTNLGDNQATKDIGKLSATSGAMPDHGKLRSHWSIGYNIVPFYAKMSFWGTRIIYFDMMFTPHVGMTTYDQRMEGGDKSQSELSYGLDVTQLFFFSKYFAVRVDLKNQWHQESVVKYRDSQGMLKGEEVRKPFTHDTLFLIGPTFYF